MRGRVLGIGIVIVMVIVIVTRDAGADGGTLPAGHGAVSLTLQTGLSKRHAGDPLSLAPDVWVGLTDRLQVGMVSSLFGRTGFWTGALTGVGASGVCLSGQPTNDDLVGCNDLVENGGAEAAYAWSSLVFSLGYYVFESHPYSYQVKLGVRKRQRWEHVSVGLGGTVMLGRDASFFYPIEVGWNLGDRAVLAMQSGFQRYVEDEAVPVALGGIFMLSPTLVVAGSFSLDRVWGFDGPGAFDRRSASLMVGTML